MSMQTSYIKKSLTKHQLFLNNIYKSNNIKNPIIFKIHYIKENYNIQNQLIKLVHFAQSQNKLHWQTSSLKINYVTTNFI